MAPSATLAVDAKAKALQAAGEHVIGFGAGEPDFPTPAHIVEAAVEACRDPAHHRYTPTGGIPALREAIAAKTLRDSNYAVTAQQVLVSAAMKDHREVIAVVMHTDKPGIWDDSMLLLDYGFDHPVTNGLGMTKPE